MRTLLLLLCLTFPLAAQTPPCVKVQRAAGAGMANVGSGTCVSSDGAVTEILTCWHVVPDTSREVKVLTGGKWYAAEFVRADPATDLALLRVRANLPCAIMAKLDPPVNAWLWQWGHPGGGPPVMKAGQVRGEGTSYTGGWRRPSLEVGTPSVGGDSGAGLFNADGHLTGVASSVPDIGRPSFTMVVRPGDVRRFLAGGK
jgi:serine protease Do